MPGISHRSQALPASPFRALIPLAEQALAAGKTVYPLNIGQPDLPTPEPALQALRQRPIQVLPYSPARGNLSYRTALSRYYQRQGIALNPDAITITTGGSEAIQLFFLAAMDPGDGVLIPEPFYANYRGFADVAGLQVHPLTCHLKDGFALPAMDQIEAALRPNTRAILLNNPNNPTGTFYTPEQLAAIADVVQRHDLYLLVDEVYREFCYELRGGYSALHLSCKANNVVVVDSISKRYSACGARVGAIISRNQSLMQAVEAYAKLRLSPPGLGQFLAEALLDLPDHYLQNVREEYRKRRDIVHQRLRDMPGVESYQPGGAFYCFAGFPIDDATRFCAWLLNDFEHEGATVMLSPGTAFYATPGLGQQELRIAFVLNTEELSKAMDCLEVALQRYPALQPSL